MKNAKKLLLILLSVLLIGSLLACGGNDACTSHTDENSDGKCDTCGETVETNENNGDTTTTTGIDLIKDGKICFQVVRDTASGGDVRMHLASLTSTISSLGGTLNVVEDKAGNEQDVEILIGDVTSRGEKYTYDKHNLGVEGYIIKVVDNKIIINAGSLAVLSETVENFIKNVLKITASTTELSDVTMTAENEVLKVQDNYRITSISINGAEINGYTIAFDDNNVSHRIAATSLNKFLYENAGYWLPTVSLEEAGKSIIIEAVDYAGEDGFLIETQDNGALTIKCAYANAFDKAFETFFNNELRLKRGDINFGSDYKYTDCISVVYYEDFGAKGDGYTDDYLAIKATHDYANEGGQTVKAKNNKTYYIHLKGEYNDNGDFKVAETVFIRTNVEWGNAKFIIDNTDVAPFGSNSHSNGNIFSVESDYKSYNKTLVDDEAKALFPNGASRDLRKLDWKADYPVMMILYNDNHQDHVRYGGVYVTRGRVQKEIIIVDENGNIDETTTLLYDFTEVTDVAIRRIDDKPITISGGTFTTLACNLPLPAGIIAEQCFTNRGISVARSNVTLKGVQHYVKNEPAGTTLENRGLSCNGFFVVNQANNVTLENCVLTGKKYYNIAGTYDFASTLSNKVTLKNCTQSNFHLTDGRNSMQDTAYWGCGTSNYTKNLVYDGTTLSRFDAHASMYHGKIINSTVTSINLIGGGDMLIENSTIEVVAGNLIFLRTDYGATWRGTVTIKDSTVVYHHTRSNTPREFNIIYMPWANHDFGYPCHMPNLILDNITYRSDFELVNIISAGGTNGSPDAPTFSITTERYLHLDTLSNGDKNINPMHAPEFIELRNNAAKMAYKIFDVPFFYNTKIIGDIEARTV